MKKLVRSQEEQLLGIISSDSIFFEIMVLYQNKQENSRLTKIVFDINFNAIAGCEINAL